MNKRLMAEYKKYNLEPNEFYTLSPDENNFNIWNILIFGPPETIFEGGVFPCRLSFPLTYPNKPPEFRFTKSLPHPNIYPDGRVCISILHEGQDEYGYEKLNERWNPTHSANSIIMSIISILNNPNFESPANVDISILWKNNFKAYSKIIYNIVKE